MRAILRIFLTLGMIVIVGTVARAQNTSTQLPAKSQAIPAETVVVKGVAEPIYHHEKGISPVRVIQNPSPDYSDEARRKKVEGVVTLNLVVTSEGKPANVRIANARGYGLDEKAVKAVRKWRFSPATKDGKAISMEIAIEVDFHLYGQH